MKVIITLLLLLNFINSSSQDYHTVYFSDGNLRIDYLVTDDRVTKTIEVTALSKGSFWAGPEQELTDNNVPGEMKVELFDSTSGKLIYTGGYSTYYSEWRTTDTPAGIKASFPETVRVPFPRSTIRLVISERNRDAGFNEMHKQYIDPALVGRKMVNTAQKHEYRKIAGNGIPQHMLDIVFLSEGYTDQQKEKFYSDVSRIAGTFEKVEPYAGYAGRINIGAVFVPSAGSGISDPGDSSFAETAFGISFNTLGTGRYMMAADLSGVHDILDAIPYDQVCIIVNTDKYGGGGIYNYLTVFTADHMNSEFLFHHEFAHAFACLADEYFTSQVAYGSMFQLHIEPYQPNITTLVDFDCKWKSLVHDTVPIPTPYLRAYYNTIGVFEGAGYSATGIYRPYYNCWMKSVSAEGFCPVCLIAIENRLKYYCR